MIAVMIATVSVLMFAHAAEMIVWSLAHAAIDVAQAGTDVLYFAFVNYTTLGYGDVVPVERWRLIGPITAMNGMLVFGWSTAAFSRSYEEQRRTVLGRGLSNSPRLLKHELTSCRVADPTQLIERATHRHAGLEGGCIALEIETQAQRVAIVITGRHARPARARTARAAAAR